MPVPPRPSDVSTDKGIMQALPSARNPVLRRPPALEDYINVTSTCGERAFLVLRADLTGTGVQVCGHSMGLPRHWSQQALRFRGQLLSELLEIGTAR